MHKLRLLRQRCSPADAAPERNGLACYLAVEGTEQQLFWIRRVQEVEPAPVDAGRWRRQGVVRVPKEGSSVRQVADKMLVTNSCVDTNAFGRTVAAQIQRRETN